MAAAQNPGFARQQKFYRHHGRQNNQKKPQPQTFFVL